MEEPARERGLRRAIFLDRDGVINVKLPEDQYVCEPSEFRLISGVAEALRTLHELGFLLVVITNQRGISRGFMSCEDLERVHGHMELLLREQGITLDDVRHCPHDAFEQCHCRKPEPGMILEAVKACGIDVAASYMVGDSPSDVAAGRNAGAKTVRITRGDDPEADFVFGSLLEFAFHLRNEMNNGSPGLRRLGAP